MRNKDRSDGSKARSDAGVTMEQERTGTVAGCLAAHEACESVAEDILSRGHQHSDKGYILQATWCACDHGMAMLSLLLMLTLMATRLLYFCCW